MDRRVESIKVALAIVTGLILIYLAALLHSQIRSNP
jgi:hypothetical protein